MSNQKVSIDTVKFKEIFRAIFRAYTENTGVFTKLRAENFGPQNMFRPKGVSIGSQDHLYWLTLVALSDKRTNSTFLYKCFAKMFTRNKSLFKRGFYPSVRRMEKLFRAYTIALPVKEIGFFLERKRHLDELFGGDAFKIFEGVSNIDELMTKLKVTGRKHGIRNVFPGAKQKIFSLLAMFLSEFKVLMFKDVVPVDTWVQAIAVMTGIVHGKGRIKDNVLERKLRPSMSELYSEFRYLLGTSNATWILGKACCTHCWRKDMTNLCPIFSLCSGPFWRYRHEVSGRHYGQFLIPPENRGKWSDQNDQTK